MPAARLSMDDLAVLSAVPSAKTPTPTSFAFFALDVYSTASAGAHFLVYG
jgi:hypothetical protein